jgi:dihydrolipoamide dehydrogenase
MEAYDLIVIGAGPGGYPAAIRSAQLGAKTAIIEREWLGGTCLNCGCIPTKAIISGSALYQQIQNAGDWGISGEGASFDYSAMIARKNGIVDKLKGGVGALLKANKVDLIEGSASFTGPKTVSVKSDAGDEIALKGEKIIIATGSTSAMPAFLPKHARVLESRAFLDLDELPQSLLVMGGGYIGCEIACMVAGLGVKVTIVEMMDDILILLDKDARGIVKRHMQRELGIEIITGNPLENIEAGGDGITAKAGDSELSADLLLVATGRAPVTDGLELEQAGIDLDDNGHIPVDKFSRTKTSSIYAIGDVTGRIQLAHAATSQGIYAAETALGHALKPAETLIPGVIFTMPEVAIAGMTESEASEQGIEIEKGKFAFAGLGKGLASGETEGFVKLIVEAGTDRIIGAQTVGAHATDLIAEACLAIRAELTPNELGNTVHGHPTFAESWMEAAHAVHGTCIHAPPARRC